MVILRNDKLLEIKFPPLCREEFYRLLAVVKSLFGRKYEADTKTWTAPFSIWNLKLLGEEGFELSDELKEKLESYYREFKRVETKDLKRNELKRQFPRLREYQIDGLMKIERAKGNVVLADPAGLGKTCQFLCWALLHPELRPVLVVCPAFLKLNWEREIRKWWGKDVNVNILYGTTPSEKVDGDIVIINYDILSSWLSRLLFVGFRVIGGDECQYISNQKAKRSKAFITLARSIDCKILMSGTPIKNRPSEFFNTLNLIAPTVFNSRWNYYEQFCDLKKTYFGWEYKGATNIDVLVEKIKPYFLRREKSEVLPELPEKTKIILPMESRDRKLLEQYRDREEEFIESLREVRKVNVNSIDVMEELKRLAYDVKRELVMDWVREYIENEKLVLFAFHRDTIRELYEEFRDKAVMVYGGVKDRDKQEAIDRFNTDDAVRLFIGQINAVGLGVNLHCSCRSVAFAEFGWSPAEHDQASDRVHRLGQRDGVMVYYLVANDTIDMNISEMLVEKNRVVSRILSGDKEQEFFGDDLPSVLFEGYRRRIAELEFA